MEPGSAVIHRIPGAAARRDQGAVVCSTRFRFGGIRSSASKEEAIVKHRLVKDVQSFSSSSALIRNPNPRSRRVVAQQRQAQRLSTIHPIIMPRRVHIEAANAQLLEDCINSVKGEELEVRPLGLWVAGRTFAQVEFGK